MQFHVDPSHLPQRPENRPEGHSGLGMINFFPEAVLRDKVRDKQTEIKVASAPPHPIRVTATSTSHPGPRSGLIGAMSALCTVAYGRQGEFGQKNEGTESPKGVPRVFNSASPFFLIMQRVFLSFHDKLGLWSLKDLGLETCSVSCHGTNVPGTPRG